MWGWSPHTNKFIMAVHQQQGLVTKVSLSLSCKGLLKADLCSKSDPIIQVLMLQSDNWVEIGRTEHMVNTSNPEFMESITVDYKFEEVQKIKYLVYDIDNATDSLRDDDYLGYLECNLAHIVSSKMFTKGLVHPTNKEINSGTITIYANEVRETNTEIKLHFQGSHLDNKDTFGKSDPFLEISKVSNDNNFIPVHRSLHIDNTLNPNWEPFYIPLQKLCNSNYDLQLKIKCYDYDNDGGHDLIGEFCTTLGEMLKADSVKLQWDLINPKKLKKKKGYKNSGVIMLESINVIPSFSFLDYIMSGCQINFTVGIDFTASNGDPTCPSSLHYMNPNEPNEYLKSLIAVGEICQDYDTDKMFPALGFGAKIPPHSEVSFEFPLNFNPSNPYCQGIFGIVAAYQACVRQITLWGPTNIAPIVNHVIKFTESILADNENFASNYFILLLLTDGEITDLQSTVDAIVLASYLPISLIIVGVGNADFSAMNFLDCDNGKLKDSKNIYAFRDIVQFVPFRKFRQENPAELARSVLGEVPKQVAEYYKLKGIEPNLQQQTPIPISFPPL